MNNMKNTFLILAFLVLNIIIATAGDPVSGVSVVLKSKSGGQQFTIKTDNNGLAVFKDIPAGNYSVKVVKESLISVLSSSFNAINTSNKNNKNKIETKDVQAKYELKLLSSGMKEKQISKNYSVNFRSSSSGNQITSADDWECPVALNTLLGTGGETGGGLGGLKYTLEVRIKKI